MAVAIPEKEEIEVTKNIIIGYGEIKAVHTSYGLRWALPGGVLTHCKKEATRAAQILDELYQYNMQKYRRKLFEL